MPTLVLIRHGQSAWNLENRFTGWWDVDLTEQGRREAWAAGEAMKAAGHSKPEMTWQYTVTDAGREREHVETILSRVLTAGGVM